MSYFHYIACSRELPIGRFGVKPMAVYDSYAQYMRSVHYTHCDDSEDERLMRYGGDVAVYATEDDLRYGIRIDPFQLARSYPVDADWTKIPQKQLRTEERLFRKNFTLPHLYAAFFSRHNCAASFLCQWLAPGDRAELFTHWASDLRPRSKANDVIIDLQAFVEGRICVEEEAGNSGFVSFIAPKEPREDPRLLLLSDETARIAVCLK